jgi:3-deoxy-D-manno-octulosonic-acid transferase
MRSLYSLATLLLLPVFFAHLLWRARRQPDYLRHWGERIGLGPRLSGPVIWLHAISVGETRAAAPLISALLHRYPDHRILLTHTTPTGRATGRELFAERVVQAYLPYDLPWAVRLFLHRSQPRMGLLMETEIWPNLYVIAAQRDIPLFLVNARMSEKSARGYAQFARLTRTALQHLTAVAAQTEADAERLTALGARTISVCGNIKFDVATPADTPARVAELRTLFGTRPVWLAASTREGEEALILDAWQRHGSDALLVIVPRHPQRFDAVAALLRARGIPFVQRSAGLTADTDTEVVLGDSMGEMAAYYGAADMAYIGGSLLPLGGQNLIEAAAMGCPILIGPHTFNFTAVAEAALAAGAALRVADAKDLVRQVHALLNDAEQRAQMRVAGLAFAAQHQGATHRIVTLISAAHPPS